MHIRSKHSIKSIAVSHLPFAPPSCKCTAAGRRILFPLERRIASISEPSGMHFPGVIQGSRGMCAQSELAKVSLFVDSCPMKWVLGLQLYIHSFTAHWANSCGAYELRFAFNALVSLGTTYYHRVQSPARAMLCKFDICCAALGSNSNALML